MLKNPVYNQLLFIVLGAIFACAQAMAESTATAIEPGDDPGQRTVAYGSKTNIIEEIRFEGNEVTRPALMLQEMRVKVGDPVDFVAIKKSRQAIMDLDLFKSVSTRLVPGNTGYILIVAVEEKYYILPLPKINRNADGDIKLGAEFRMDNLFGLNQRLKISWDRTRHTQEDLDDKDKTEIEYRYPRVLGTPYFVEFEIDQEKTNVEELNTAGQTVTARMESNRSEVGVSRWLDPGPSRGWRFGGNVARSRTQYHRESDNGRHFQDTHYVAFKTFVNNQNVHNLEFSRTGSEYGYSVAAGVTAWGSDEGYSTHQLFYRSYFHLFGWEHHNLNTQLNFGFSNFSQGAFSLGGADTLRGYERGTIVGNSLVQLNVEYLFPVMGYYPFRILVFGDAANVYPKLSETDLTDMKYAVGLGFRWKLRAFVKTDLRFDYAYATETKETKIYASTSETF